jgi:hypothetical protein
MAINVFFMLHMNALRKTHTKKNSFKFFNPQMGERGKKFPICLMD